MPREIGSADAVLGAGHAVENGSCYSAAIIESMPGVFYVIDEQGRFLCWNKNLESVTGYSAQEIAHLQPWDLFKGPDQELVRERIQQVFSRGFGYVEADLVSKNGQGAAYNFTGQRVVLDQKPCLIGLGVDITDRKQAEDALRKGEEKFRAIADYTYDWENWVGPDGKLLWVNSAVERVTGYSPQEVMSMRDFPKPLVLEEDWPKIQASFQQSVQGQATVSSLEFRIRRKDGQIIWGAVAAQAIYDDQGRQMGHRSSIRDITDRKRSEEELRNRTEELAALNSLSKEVSSSLSEATVVACALKGIFNTIKPDRVFMFLREGDRLILAGAEPPGSQEHVGQIPEHRVGQCLCGMAVKLAVSLYSKDIFKDVRCTWDECKRAGIRSFAALPLRGGDEIAGVIALASLTQRDFECQSRFLETLADTVSASLRNARLFVQTKRAEDALQRSEMQMVMALGAARMGVWNYDAVSGDITTLRGLGPITGLPKDLYPSNIEAFEALVHPDDRQSVNQAIQEALTLDRSYNIEFRICLAQEEIRWVSAFGHGVRDAAGRPVGLTGVDLDITERKRSENALRESEELFRRIFYDAPVGIVLASTQGVLQQANPAFCAFLGYSQEELRGKTVKDITHPDDWPVCVEEMRSAQSASQTVRRWEKRYLHKNGQVLWGEISISMVVDVQGVPNFFISQVRDITERKRNEQALRSSEEQLRQAVRVAGLGIFDHDHLSDTIQWSPEMRAFCGFGPDEQIGLAKWEQFVHPEDRVRIVQAIQEAHDPAGKGLYAVEHRIVRRDGEVRWLSVRSQTFFEGQAGARRPVRTIGAIADITESKVAEMALRESEEKHKLLIETTGTGYVVIDDQGRLIDANPEYVRLTGRQRLDEMLDHSVLEWTAPHDRDRNDRELKKCIETGFVRNLEIDYITPGGKITPIEINATMHHDFGAVQILTLCRDITQRKRAEEALRESERKYRELVENANSIILRWGPDGRVTFLNEFGQQFFGYKEQEICGRHVIGTIVPETEAGGRSLQTLMSEICANPEAFEQNINENVRRNGERVWIAWTNKVVLDPRGRVIEILSIGTDITERKRAQEALQLNVEHTRALLSLNQMFDSPIKEITDFAMEAAIRLTGSALGYVAFASEDESVLTMQSWSKAAMDECGIADKPLVYPTETTGLWGEVVRQRKAIITNDYAAPSPLKRGYPQGHVAIRRHMNVPVFSGSRIVVVAGVGNKERPYDDMDVRQLTLLMEGMWRHIERRNSLEAIRKVNEDLRRSNRDLEQFAYVASHDLQEPLRMVTSYMDLLETRYKGRLDKDSDQFIGFAVDGAHRMKQLISDLLTYSRITSHGKEPRLVSVQAAFGRAMADLRGVIAETGAQVTHDSLPEVMGDETQLTQLLVNLLSNAIKFRGEQPPRVHLGARKEGAEWIFSVRDNGIGIAPEGFERIFQVFQRLHTRQKYPGSGIGLAVCKRIVERHGGRIWVESQAGRGSTFFFAIPA